MNVCVHLAEKLHQLRMQVALVLKRARSRVVNDVIE